MDWHPQRMQKFIPQLWGDRVEDPDGPRLLSSRFGDTLILIEPGRTISYNLFDFEHTTVFLTLRSGVPFHYHIVTTIQRAVGFTILHEAGPQLHESRIAARRLSYRMGYLCANPQACFHTGQLTFDVHVWSC